MQSPPHPSNILNKLLRADSFQRQQSASVSLHFKQFAIDRVAGNDAISTGGSTCMGDLTVTSNRLQTMCHHNLQNEACKLRCC